jgi:hypothetical protein
MPRNRLWILTASHGGQMLAYAIFKRQDLIPETIPRMRLIDVQTLEPQTDLLSVAIARCRAERLCMLEHLGCGLGSGSV